jgi:hypothetical protein
MSLVEALNLLKRVCADYRGTLQEHQLLQQALQIVEKECSRDLEIPKKEVENKG